MIIHEPEYVWKYNPGLRAETNFIIIHHSAGQGSAESIHAYHRDGRGWAGIAYHYYVRHDGTVYRGRPENWKGGHTSGYNGVSVGVCFEGNFQEHTMPEMQFLAGRELISQLREKYPEAEILRHRDLGATACPGEKFPFEEMIKPMNTYRTLADVPEAYREAIRRLMEKGALSGRSDPDPHGLEDNILDISEDYCRVMATLARLGVI